MFLELVKDYLMIALVLVLTPFIVLAVLCGVRGKYSDKIEALMKADH